jgi:post-segregation antitoxin (ccd killing protein)
MLKKVENKVSLNIKVSSEMNDRLKRVRDEARKRGMKFNVSASVEDFLEKELKKVEKKLSCEQDINEWKSQESIDVKNKA